MDYELGGKTALITGASQGLGRQFALTLARAGAGVVVASRNTDRLDELAREIETGGGSAHVVSLDVTDGASNQHLRSKRPRGRVRLGRSDLDPVRICRVAQECHLDEAAVA